MCAGRASADGLIPEDAAERFAQNLVRGLADVLGVNERMDDPDEREARPDHVADGRPAALGVPAKEALVGPADAPDAPLPFRDAHLRGQDLEDVGPACGVEDVVALEEA